MSKRSSVSIDWLPGTAGLCIYVLIPALLWVFSTAISVQAGEWTRELRGGGTVSVDPATNRATLSRQGVMSPLPDGVHQLKDGSTIEIHAGIVVPTANMLESRQLKLPLPPGSQWIGKPFVGDSPCKRLVQRVCGVAEKCASATGCVAAQQLLEMEKEERVRATPKTMTYSSGQCLEAGKDTEIFVTCSLSDK